MRYSKYYQPHAFALALVCLLGSGCHPLPSRNDGIIQQLNHLKIDMTGLYDNLNSNAYLPYLQKVQAEDSMLFASEIALSNNDQSIQQVKLIIEQVSTDSTSRVSGPLSPALLAAEKQNALELVDETIKGEEAKPIN
jgi:hypothetical protein